MSVAEVFQVGLTRKNEAPRLDDVLGQVDERKEGKHLCEEDPVGSAARTRVVHAEEVPSRRQEPRSPS